MVDLTTPQSTENMGWRWVLEVGFENFSERWAVDLGPKVGVFQPRYGMVGYHNGGHSACGIKPEPSHDCFENVPDDKRYFNNIQSMTIRPDRHYPSGTPMPDMLPAPIPGCTMTGADRCCLDTVCCGDHSCP
jgi:hypothetical protein